MRQKLLALTVLSLAFSANAFAESLQGTISDAMCGAKHVKATAADMACAQKCVKGGSPAVLVVGDKIYKIDNQNAVEGHVGHKVTVTGTVTGDSIHVEDVKM